MSPAFVDTSYVIALFNRTDPYHQKAKDLLDSLKSQGRSQVTTTAILLELGDGFARKGRWDLIAPFLEAVSQDPLLELVTVDSLHLTAALQLRNSRLDKSWGLTDCVSFVLMKDGQLQDALTADRHFQQAGFRALLLEP